MSTPRSAALTTEFADSVRRGLGSTPKQLDPRYFYDDLGSALFDAICRLPWYAITRTERRMLEAHAQEILQDRRRIVELGCGSGEKLVALVAPVTQAVAGVHLVDVSQAALDATRRRLDLAGVGPVSSHCGPYEDGLRAMRARRADREPVLVLFLGSNIGNFEPARAQRFLCDVRAALRGGDRLLLGTDLVKPEAALLLAYDDPLGVTAAFNLNLLQRINRELGGTFDLRAWRHAAVWNAADSRVEMYLVAERTQSVNIDGADLDMVFAAGDRIWTESSYKYERPQVASMLERAGFIVQQHWTDEDARFCLTMAAV